MFEWFYHLLGLKSPREMHELDAQFRRDWRKGELQLARALAETLPPEMRAKTMARIAETERKEGCNS